MSILVASETEIATLMEAQIRIALVDSAVVIVIVLRRIIIIMLLAVSLIIRAPGYSNQPVRPAVLRRSR
jgi:hypothetical protein